MTTVIWDGEQIASDSRCLGDFIHSGATQKIFHYPELGYYFGVSGHYIPACYFVRWIAEGRNPDERPEVLDAESRFNILWITENGGFASDDGVQFMPVDPPFAIGSGSHLALGAIAAGAPIEESVRIASLYDHGSDDQVVVYEILPPVPAPKKKRSSKKRSKKS